MKKKTLLTLAATAAVVTTTAASYAVWDVTTVTRPVSITTGKGITISASELNFTGTLADSTTGETEIVADFTVSVDGDTTDKKLTFTTSDMKLGDVAKADAVVVKVTENNTDVTAGDESLTDTNTYKVKVSLPAGTTATDYANKKIGFNLTADLVAK